MPNILKRIEMQGFKSFANKTVLEFPGSIVGVVGPNGSGKSNIVDAIRWVLGEREAKQLRGGTLDTLIFAGTPKKPAMGFARVELTFDNAKRLFPLEAEEITVSRKIDRSGASTFFINENETKLKDLIPFLLQAKLSSRGMLIIGQGKSDVFVKSSPEERRFMIEEILGLREFRMKKNQAERRLEISAANIEKVKVMIQEIAPHLRFLRKQKTRWDKRTEIETTLRALEDYYFGRETSELYKKLHAAEKPIAEKAAKKTEKEDAVKELQKSLREAGSGNADRSKGEAIQKKIADCMRRYALTNKELAHASAKRELAATQEARSAHTADELEKLLSTVRDDMKTLLSSNDLGIIKTTLEKWFHTIGEFLHTSPKHKETIDKELKTLEEKHTTELAAIEKEMKALREEETKLMEMERGFNEEYRKRLETLEAHKNELNVFERELQTLLFEKEKVVIKLQELERQWESAGRKKSELEHLAIPSPSPFTELSMAEIEKKTTHLRGELAAIGEIDQAALKETEETEHRYAFLEKEITDLETASENLKNLIKELDEKIHADFKNAFARINEEFNTYFNLMFNGGKARLKMQSHMKKEEIEELHEEEESASVRPLAGAEKKEIYPHKSRTAGLERARHEEEELLMGVEIDVNVPRKKITSLEMLSGGEKSLVSAAALFALIAVSPPPFLVLDEIDAALDETNASRFASLVKEFSRKTQFIIVTHNRYTMETADLLYGVTMADDGVSKVLSVKLDNATVDI